ncbi:benzoate-CoA ligase family protein [Thermus sp.]|uniref:benzoate-CoA ligase family protein n=1 Tax=Thermus sp. TaxID=275 RepID=UPI0025D84F62|nr:benzoate-CoA ligase family protein [Thermus sp.]MCS6869535.1 benzoate-CoA ligase family protein [Thermus sp.]
MLSLPERYNVSTILDRNLERGLADKVAIHWDGGTLTYGALFHRVCAFGRALKALGVRREERLLMVLDDTWAFPVVFLGAIRLGAVPIPVNPLLHPEEYLYFLEDSYARVVVADGGSLPRVAGALSGLEGIKLVVCGAEPPEGTGGVRLEELLEEHAGELPPADTHRDDMAFWLYSSGSTGKPKGVVHLQHDIPYTCETYAKQVLKIHEGDITFSASKLFHAYGLGNNLSFPYWVGAGTVLLQGRPTPDRVLDTIERFRPTLFFTVPTLYNAILNHPGSKERDLSSIRFCVSAAEPLPGEIWRRWKETFGLVILDGIGSTEMLHIYCSNTPEALKPGSSGKPVPGYELRLLSPEGTPVPPGEAGDLWVKGDSALAFYWHQHEKTKRSLQGEWFYTGDRYRMDEEGFFWYEGRSDDMIKVKGLWVSPIEIENTLMEHPAVREAAVVGIQVEGLTRIKAFVILHGEYAPSEALTRELQEWCKARLRPYQYPEFVAYVEDFPRTATGKVQRFRLRELQEA